MDEEGGAASDVKLPDGDLGDPFPDYSGTLPISGVESISIETSSSMSMDATSQDDAYQWCPKGGQGFENNDAILKLLGITYSVDSDTNSIVIAHQVPDPQTQRTYKFDDEPEN